MEINLREHLGEDLMQQIAEDEFRKLVRQQTKDDFERILSNAGYELVHREVDAAFDGGMAATISQKAMEVIDGISAHTVFRAPTYWEPQPSVAWKHLESAMTEAKPAIVARVQTIIDQMGEEKLRELLEGVIADAIIAKLTAPAPAVDG